MCRTLTPEIVPADASIIVTDPIPGPTPSCLVLLGAWGVIGFAGLVRPASVFVVGRLLFPLGALVASPWRVLALASIAQPRRSLILPIGLPDLPFHVRRDALTRVFLFLLGAASAGISVFGAGYFRSGEGTAPGLLCLQYHLFLASMGFVLLADDAYAFMFAWETMALSSYFLVTTQHRLPDIRRAGFLYLLMAHLGAIGILLSFGVMQGGSWQFTFDAMRAAELPPAWAAVAFLLALLGFGAKAGSRPAARMAAGSAPRRAFAGVGADERRDAEDGALRRAPRDVRSARRAGLVVGCRAARSRTVDRDLRRRVRGGADRHEAAACLLVHREHRHSVYGRGARAVFYGVGMNALASLALVAVLYHALNHAFMKSLLFIGTGSVLHATGERNLGKLGGLIHRMPWVAWLTLVGASP